jgi:hypothetical protein
MKICTRCNTSCGARSKACKSCGQTFKMTEKKAAVKSGIRPTLPTGRKLTFDEVQEVVSFEGLTDAADLIKSERISDKQLKKLWDELKDCMKRVRKHIYSKSRSGVSLYED